MPLNYVTPTTPTNFVSTEDAQPDPNYVSQAGGSLMRGLRAAQFQADANNAALETWKARQAGDVDAAGAAKDQALTLAQQAQGWQPRVSNYEQIHDPSDAASWAAGVFGGAPVALAKPMAEGLVGGLLGRRLGLRGAQAGSMLGNWHGMADAGAPALQQLQAEQNGAPAMPPDEAMSSFNSQAAVSALPMAVVPGMMTSSLVGAGRQLAAKQVLSGAVPRMVRDAGMNAGLGYGARMIDESYESDRDPNRDTSGDESARRNAAASNALLGAPMGLGGHGGDTLHSAIDGSIHGGIDAGRSVAGAAWDGAKRVAGMGADAVAVGMPEAKQAWDSRPKTLPSLDEAALAIGQGAAKVHTAAEDAVDRLMHGTSNADADALLKPQRGTVDELKADDKTRNEAATRLAQSITGDDEAAPELRTAAEKYLSSSRKQDMWKPLADAAQSERRSVKVSKAADSFQDELALKMGKAGALGRKFADDVSNTYEVGRSKQNAQMPEPDELDPVLAHALLPHTGLNNADAGSPAMRKLVYVMRKYAETGFGTGGDVNNEPVVPKSLHGMFKEPALAVDAVTEAMIKEGYADDDLRVIAQKVVAELQAHGEAKKDAGLLVEEHLKPSAQFSGQYSGADHQEIADRIKSQIRNGGIDKNMLTKFRDPERLLEALSRQMRQDGELNSSGERTGASLDSDEHMGEEGKASDLEGMTDAIKPNEVKDVVRHHHYHEGWAAEHDKEGKEVKPAVPVKPYRADGVITDNDSGETVGTHDAHATARAEKLEQLNRSKVTRQGYVDYLREVHGGDNMAFKKAVVALVRHHAGEMTAEEKLVPDMALNKKLYVLREATRSDSKQTIDVDPSDFLSVSPGKRSNNKWAISTGKNNEFGTAEHGVLWFQRASDGKEFAVSTRRIISRMNASRKAGEVSDTGHDVHNQAQSLMTGISSLLNSGVRPKETPAKQWRDMTAEERKTQYEGGALTAKVGVLDKAGGAIRWMEPGKFHGEMPDGLTLADGRTTLGEARGLTDKKTRAEREKSVLVHTTEGKTKRKGELDDGEGIVSELPPKAASEKFDAQALPTMNRAELVAVLKDRNKALRNTLGRDTPEAKDIAEAIRNQIGKVEAELDTRVSDTDVGEGDTRNASTYTAGHDVEYVGADGEPIVPHRDPKKAGAGYGIVKNRARGSGRDGVGETRSTNTAPRYVKAKPGEAYVVDANGDKLALGKDGKPIPMHREQRAEPSPDRDLKSPYATPADKYNERGKSVPPTEFDDGSDNLIKREGTMPHQDERGQPALNLPEGRERGTNVLGTRVENGKDAYLAREQKLADDAHSALPEHLRGHIPSVEVVGRKDIDGAAARSYGADKPVHLAREVLQAKDGDNPLGMTKGTFLKWLMAHEAAHNLDEAHKNVFSENMNTTFEAGKALYNALGENSFMKRVLKNAYTSADRPIDQRKRELVAQLAALHTHDPALLKREFPQGHDFVERMLKYAAEQKTNDAGRTEGVRQDVQGVPRAADEAGRGSEGKGQEAAAPVQGLKDPNKPFEVEHVREVDDDYGNPTAAVYATRHATLEEAHKAAESSTAEFGARVRENRQHADLPNTKRATPEELKAANDYIDKALGPQMKREFLTTLGGHSADWLSSMQGTVIRVATNAVGGVHTNAVHESMHEFFNRLLTGKQKDVTDLLTRVASNAIVTRSLERILADHPGALASLKDPEERLAYAYQFWEAGHPLLKLGPQATTFFEKVAKFIRNITGLMRDDEKAEAIFRQFKGGEFASDVSVAGKVLADLNNGQKRVDAISKTMEPFRRHAIDLVGSAEDNLLKSDNPVLKKMGESFADHNNGYIQGHDRAEKQWMSKLKNVLAPFDKDDVAAALEGLQTGNLSSDKQIRAVQDGIRGLLDEIHPYLKDAGVSVMNQATKKWEPIGKLEHYFPRSWNMDELYKRGPEFTQKLLNTHRKELEHIAGEANKEVADGKGAGGGTASDLMLGRAPADRRDITAEDIASSIYNRLMGSDGQHDLAQNVYSMRFSPMMKAVNQRTLDWIDMKQFHEYQNKDIVHIMSGYIMQATKRAEYTRRFGPDGQLLHDQMRDARFHELDKLIGMKGASAKADLMSAKSDFAHELAAQVNSTKPKTPVTADEMREKQVEAWKKTTQAQRAIFAMEGTLGHDINPTLRKAQGWVLAYENWRMLPMALFSNLIDPLGILVRGGTMNDTFSAYKTGLQDVINSWRGKDRDDNLTQMHEMIGTLDAHGYLSSMGQMLNSVYMGGGAKRMNDKLFQLNGMEALNRSMRGSATQAAIGFIKRHATQPNEHSERLLKEVGLDAKYVKSKIGADTGNGAGGLDVTDPHIQNAIAQWVNEAILRPNSATRPSRMSDPHYALISMYKPYMYAMHKQILGRAAKEAKLGNYTAASTLALGYVPMMFFADMGKLITQNAIAGNAKMPAWWQAMDAKDHYEYATERAGLLGPGQMLRDAGEYGPSSVLGPVFEQMTSAIKDPLGKTAMDAMPWYQFFSSAQRAVND